MQHAKYNKTYSNSDMHIICDLLLIKSHKLTLVLALAIVPFD